MVPWLRMPSCWTRRAADGCDAGCRLRIVANVIRGDIRQLPENVHFGLTINLPARFNRQYGLMFLQPACRMSLCKPTFRSANIVRRFEDAPDSPNHSVPRKPAQWKVGS